MLSWRSIAARFQKNWTYNLNKAPCIAIGRMSAPAKLSLSSNSAAWAVCLLVCATVQSELSKQFCVAPTGRRLPGNQDSKRPTIGTPLCLVTTSSLLASRSTPLWASCRTVCHVVYYHTSCDVVAAVFGWRKFMTDCIQHKYLTAQQTVVPQRHGANGASERRSNHRVHWPEMQANSACN